MVAAAGGAHRIAKRDDGHVVMHGHREVERLRPRRLRAKQRALKRVEALDVNDGGPGRQAAQQPDGRLEGGLQFLVCRRSRAGKAVLVL